MIDDGGESQPQMDPTAIGQEIGRAIKEVLQPLVDQMQRIADQQDSSSKSVTGNENIERYAQSTGQSPQQAQSSVGAIRDTVVLSSIYDRMADILAAIESVSVAVSGNGGRG